jgi:hypothetical protein
MRWRESIGVGFENRHAADMMSVSTESAEAGIKRPRQ